MKKTSTLTGGIIFVILHLLLMSIRSSTKCCDSLIEDIEIHSVIYYSFNCRKRLRHTLFLLFALILDNKWIAKIYDSIVDNKKRNGWHMMLINVYIYDSAVHISSALSIRKNANIYAIGYTI